MMRWTGTPASWGSQVLTYAPAGSYCERETGVSLCRERLATILTSFCCLMGLNCRDARGSFPHPARYCQFP